MTTAQNSDTSYAEAAIEADAKVMSGGAGGRRQLAQMLRGM